VCRMSRLSHIREVFREETAGIRPRLGLSQLLVGLIPVGAGSRVRRVLYRMAGVDIGKGTVVLGRMRLTGDGRITEKLTIGRNCFLNDHVCFNLGGTVTIGDNVSVGMDCLFLTITHEMSSREARGGATVCYPIGVADGAWIAARVTVLPGVSIGPGSVVGAGAVVTRDIPANVLAAGVPAKVIRELE